MRLPGVGRWALGLRRGVPPGSAAWRVARTTAAGTHRPKRAARLAAQPLGREAATAAPANPAAAARARRGRRLRSGLLRWRLAWIGRPGSGPLLAGLALVRGRRRVGQRSAIGT